MLFAFSLLFAIRVPIAIAAGRAGGTTMVTISNDRTMMSFAASCLTIISAMVYKNPIPAMKPSTTMNMIMSLRCCGSCGFGYMMERISWPFSVENPVRRTLACNSIKFQKTISNYVPRLAVPCSFWSAELWFRQRVCGGCAQKIVERGFHIHRHLSVMTWSLVHSLPSALLHWRSHSRS